MQPKPILLIEYFTIIKAVMELKINIQKPAAVLNPPTITAKISDFKKNSFKTRFTILTFLTFFNQDYFCHIYKKRLYEQRRLGLFKIKNK